MHAIRRLLPICLIALSSAFGQEPATPSEALPPGVPAVPPVPAPTVKPVLPGGAPGAPGVRPAVPGAPGAAPAANPVNVPLADRKIVESIIEPKMTGNDLAAKYRAFTGRRVIVSAAAAAAEFAFVQEASPADPLTYGDAAKLIKMAALLEGFVFVPAGDIAPDVDKLMFAAASAGPKGEGIEVVDENDVFPNEDRVIAYVMTLKFLKPDEAVRVFTTIIGQFGSYGSLAAITNASAVIITEKTSLISKLIELKEVIDKPSSDVTTRFIKVQFADVTELAETLNQLITAQQQTQQTAGVQRTDAPVNNPGINNPNGAGGNRGASGSAESVPVQIVPDSRTNRIFVMGRPVDVVFVEGLVREFDTQTSEKNFLRRKLSFLSASEFLPIAGDALTRAFSSNSSGGSGGGAGSTGANFGQGGGASGGSNRTTGSTSGNRSTSSSRSSNSSTGGSSFGGGAGGGGGGGSDVGSLSEPSVSTAPTSLIVGRTLLVADNITNSIIVQGPPAGLEIIEKLLDEVDVRADQVMISAVFGQLTLSDNLDYGVNVIRSLDKSSLDKGNSAIGGGNVNGGNTPNIPGLLDPATYLTGFQNGGLNVYGMLSNQFNVYINALQKTGNFSVLSRPSIYTANNKKGVISSGTRIAVPTNSFNGGVNNGGQSTNIEYQDVVLKLEIIPLINSEKEVTLQIVLTSDERGEDQEISPTLKVPSIITRSMTTTVTVPNNQTVVLGGLVVARDTNDVNGIPILSSIPGLGKLFSTTSKVKEKSELLIFIQPSIVRNAENLDRVQADMDQRYKVTPSLRNFADGPGAIPPPDRVVPINEKASDYSAAGPVKTVKGNTVVEEAPSAYKKTKRMGHPGR